MSPPDMFFTKEIRLRCTPGPVQSTHDSVHDQTGYEHGVTSINHPHADHSSPRMLDIEGLVTL